MAIQLSNKNEVEVHAALSSRSARYKVMATLALAGLTTLSFAQGGTRDHARLPIRQAQSGAVPSTSPHPATTYSPVTPGQHGTTPATANMPHGHPGSQPYVHQSPVAKGAMGRSPLSGPTEGMRIEHRLSGGHRFLEATQEMPGRGTLHAVRYGTALTGVVEHPTRSGYLSRTYVQGGRVLYARVYRQHTFQRFGRAFSYERLVPSIAFGTAYYAWAALPWSTPVSYRWQWERQPWHTAFGGYFQPYPTYTSLDEWLTDYEIAQNFRNAYESWQAENAAQNNPVAKQAPPASVGSTSPQSSDAGQRPYWEEPDDGRRPYWEEPDDGRRPYWEDQPAERDAPPIQPKSSKKHDSAPNSRTGSQSPPPAEDSPPPLSEQIKAELHTQIKRQLIERQTPATTSNTDDLPDSLKPGHTLFRINTPLDVSSKRSGQYCSLRANDYIERTGDVDQNGMVPVKVRVGGPSDCAIGLRTNVSVNDLEAMESEQQQALTDALLAASKNMGGSRGLPQAPGTTPMLLAAGQTSPAPDAMTTLSQLK